MSDVIWIVLLCLAYFFAGFFYANRRIARAAEEIIKNMSAQQKQAFQVEERVGVILNHEIIDGVHYFYRQSDNTFMCQGNSLETAADAYQKREFKHVGIFKNSLDNKLYFFIDGKVIDNSLKSQKLIT